MALSPYIDEQTLTTAIKNNVPLNKQGTLTQITATNTYSVEDGLYHYEIVATDGTNNYPVASATAASATIVAGVRFSGTEGTATFDITPTGEGFSYTAQPISEFYGPVNGEAELANKVYGSVNGQAKIIHQAFGHLDYSPSIYGRVTYYSVFSLGGDFKGDYSTGLTVNSINHSQFYQFITQRNWLLSTGRTNIWFWMDGSNMMVNAERADGQWDNNFPAQQVFQQGGILVTLASQSGNLILEYGTESIDTASAVVTVDLLSNTEYQGLGKSDSAQTGVNYTIGGNTIPRNAVTGFDFGTANTSTPNYFLAYASRMVSLSIPRGTCPTTIGQYFLAYCTSFNQAITLPDTTTVGDYFLRDCQAFNQNVVLANATTIGNSFLSGCSSFNKRVSIPMVTSIGNYFLSSCKVFNQDLPLPTGLTSIGNSFLSGCSAFNQDLVLPQTLTSIGTSFLYQCNAYTQLIHLGSLSADVIASSTTSFATLTSSAPCYVTGIGLIDNTEGVTVAAWMTKFPNRTSPYRKLVDMTSGTGGGN